MFQMKSWPRSRDKRFQTTPKRSSDLTSPIGAQIAGSNSGGCSAGGSFVPSAARWRGKRLKLNWREYSKLASRNFFGSAELNARFGVAPFWWTILTA